MNTGGVCRSSFSTFYVAFGVKMVEGMYRCESQGNIFDLRSRWSKIYKRINETNK